MQVDVRSEIGELEGVIVHTPGHEVENMTPTNAERALYSDILNLSVANKEYSQFINALKKVTKVYEVKNLLTDVLKIKEAKQSIINSICTNEEVQCLKDYLFSLTTAELSTQLIEGVSVIKDTLTKFLSKERYSLLPLHNFFFTRDPSIAIGDSVLIAKMSSKVREREALIMETIFNYHPQFKTRTLNPVRTGPIDPSVTIEGGDILVVKENLL